jgi:hypothetical protein
MMYQTALTITGVAIGTPMNTRIEKSTWQVGYQAVVTGTITYNIETSIDGVIFTPVVTGVTTTAVGSISAPCKFIRLNTTAGTGTVVLNVLEVQ